MTVLHAESKYGVSMFVYHLSPNILTCLQLRWYNSNSRKSEIS